SCRVGGVGGAGPHAEVTPGSPRRASMVTPVIGRKTCGGYQWHQCPSWARPWWISINEECREGKSKAMVHLRVRTASARRPAAPRLHGQKIFEQSLNKYLGTVVDQ